jgi:Protein of unknown function (DUF2971)
VLQMRRIRQPRSVSTISRRRSRSTARIRRWRRPCRARSASGRLSAHANDQRMWGTYGDNHAGAVIHFSTDRDRSRFASHLSPVLYADTKLPFCPSHLVTERMEIDQFLLSVLFCVKHMDWRDEHEWRLLRGTGAGTANGARSHQSTGQSRWFSRLDRHDWQWQRPVRLFTATGNL